MEMEEVFKGQVLQALRTCDVRVFLRLWRDGAVPGQYPGTSSKHMFRKPYCVDQLSPDPEVIRLIVNNNRRW